MIRRARAVPSPTRRRSKAIAIGAALIASTLTSPFTGPAGAADTEPLLIVLGSAFPTASLALTATHVYDGSNAIGQIGRTRLDGTDRKGNFQDGTGLASGLAASTDANGDTTLVWSAFADGKLIPTTGNGQPGKLVEPPAIVKSQGGVRTGVKLTLQPSGVVLRPGTSDVYFSVPGWIGRTNFGSTEERFIQTGATATGLSNALATDGRNLYWTDYTGGTIGRSDFDGNTRTIKFITGLVKPASIAANRTHLFWSSDNGTIGRANLDGSGVEPAFMTGVGSVRGLAADDANLYWGRFDVGSIGRQKLSASPPPPQPTTTTQPPVSPTTTVPATTLAATTTLPGAPVSGNRPPVAQANAVVVAGGTPTPIVLTGSDPDGTTVTYALGALPAHGRLSGQAPALVYEPAAGFTGTDAFTFTVSDGAASSAPATVTITVTGSSKPKPKKTKPVCRKVGKRRICR